jgi:hypothetical protein
MQFFKLKKKKKCSRHIMTEKELGKELEVAIFRR